MAEDQEPRMKALARLNEMELSPTNPHVRAAAKRLRFKPETLVKRTEEAFPSKFEQRVYVIISRIWKRAAHPETISACFRYFNSGQDLYPADFGAKGKGNRVLENTAQTLLLMSRGFVSKDVAMRFVERFGDRAEEVYNLIGDNLQTLMRKLGMRTFSSQAMMGILYAVAYSDSEHPEVLDLDIVTVDDVEMVLGHFTEWPDDNQKDIVALGRVEEDAYEERGDE
ncbi:MAG: hypothetical protein Q8R39_01735 [bacterium]|nr:hypothetical protein [bacterium]MDZ4285179.1 hypothetical protein [Patescibacteria group bacterium]